MVLQSIFLGKEEQLMRKLQKQTKNKSKKNKNKIMKQMRSQKEMNSFPALLMKLKQKI